MVQIDMITIGAFEAKTHLSSLLERAAAGEDVIITKHGKPLARLTGATDLEVVRRSDAFERLKLARKGVTLGGLSWQDLRDEGRR
jgi:prevent-host-death family protein